MKVRKTMSKKSKIAKNIIKREEVKIVQRNLEKDQVIESILENLKLYKEEVKKILDAFPIERLELMDKLFNVESVQEIDEGDHLITCTLKANSNKVSTLGSSIGSLFKYTTKTSYILDELDLTIESPELKQLCNELGVPEEYEHFNQVIETIIVENGRHEITLDTNLHEVFYYPHMIDIDFDRDYDELIKWGVFGEYIYIFFNKDRYIVYFECPLQVSIKKPIPVTYSNKRRKNNR